MQDIFLRALRALPTLRNPTQACPWLLQIAHRRCLDHLRHRDHFQCLSLDLGRTETEAAQWHAVLQMPAVDRETVLDVRATLQRLSARDRLLLVLRDSYELSYEEIAQVTRQNAASARKQAYRARRRFARYYGRTTPSVALEKEE
jgi:RNA polymerase sigma-70 factor (ECF subfamily)